MARRDWELALKGTKQQIERQITRAGLDLTANLVGETPVDTGWARANWIPNIGTPVTQPDGSRTRGAISTSGQEAGKAKLLGFKLTQGNIYITNNVPYITKLNAGSSKQAPSMYVEAQVTKTVNKMNQR